jgi:hypothetical protein
MLETLMMASSLAVLGYAFYISSRMFWSSRKDKGAWKLVYALISAFLIVTYGIFALVLFSFATNLFSSEYFFNTLNIVLGVLLLSGSALIGALMKYQLSVASSVPPGEEMAAGKAGKAVVSKARGGAEVAALQKEIAGLRGELDAANVMNRVAVGRELRIVELKKRIAELESKGS